MKQKKELKNISASVKERLRDISIQTGKEFQSILRQYIQERFLFRLSKSTYSNNLILKGALLFVAHDISRNRPTKDIDFLGSFMSNEKDEIAGIIENILNNESTAPKVAEFLKNREIPVAVFNTSGRTKGLTFQTKYWLEGIDLSEDKLGDSQAIRAIFFHELVHAMNPSNDEFQAFAATFSAEYNDKQEILNDINSNPKYFESGMPKEFNQYFDNGQLIKKKQAEFFNAFQYYGEQIIK